MKRLLPLVAFILVQVVACDVDGKTPMVFDPKPPADEMPGDGEEPGEGGVPEEVSFAFIQQNVITPNCALSGCHANTQFPNMSAGQAYANLVNGAASEGVQIAPGDPEASYLYRKITGADGIFEARMPRGRAPLSDDLILAVRQWIERGAPND
jgi:hypothetical protein